MTKTDLNLNTSYYATLDENFKKAVELIEQDFTHEELLKMLKEGNIPEKQLAALRIEYVTSKEEAKIFIDNLTGQDGKIREAVSHRIKDFMTDKSMLPYFENLQAYDTFLEAIIDINGNICRNIIEAISNLKDNNSFSSYFCEKLTQKTFELINKIKQFDLQDGKYKINKEVFKLYWCLETIFVFHKSMVPEKLKEIILQGKNINEYTIREKIAKILSVCNTDNELEIAKNELKNDQNYYVRRF